MNAVAQVVAAIGAAGAVAYILHHLFEDPT